MTFTKIKQINEQITAGRKLTSEEKKEITSFYGKLTSRSQKEEVSKITRVVIEIAEKCDENDRNELLTAYFSIPQEIIDIDIVKTLLEKGLLTGEFSLSKIKLSEEDKNTLLARAVIKKLNEIRSRTEHKKRITKKDRTVIQNYYSSLTQNSSKKTVGEITLEVFSVAASCDEESREFLYSTYLNIPSELIEIELLKQIFEDGLLAENSEVAIRISGFPVINSTFNQLVESIFNKVFNEEEIAISQSAKAAIKKLSNLMEPSKFIEYKEKIRSLLKNIRISSPKKLVK